MFKKVNLSKLEVLEDTITPIAGVLCGGMCEGGVLCGWGCVKVI